MYINNAKYYIIAGINELNIIDYRTYNYHPTDFSKCNHNLPIISFLIKTIHLKNISIFITRSTLYCISI